MNSEKGKQTRSDVVQTLWWTNTERNCPLLNITRKASELPSRFFHKKSEKNKKIRSTYCKRSVSDVVLALWWTETEKNLRFVAGVAKTSFRLSSTLLGSIPFLVGCGVVALRWMKSWLGFAFIGAESLRIKRANLDRFFFSTADNGNSPRVSLSLVPCCLSLLGSLEPERKQGSY